MTSAHSPEDELNEVALHTPAVVLQRGYMFLKKVGQGGFSVVYKTKVLATKKIVACKYFDMETLDQGWSNKCLKQEMKIMMAVKHPCLLQAIEVIKLKMSAFIIMQYAPNGTISDAIFKKGAPITEAQAKIWFFDIVCGVDYLHDNRIVHRDLKLENFLINKHNRALIADFGFAKMDARPKLEDSSIMSEIKCESICGTPEYMAPEINLIAEVTESDDVTVFYDGKASDIYSLGVCLFEMVNCNKPFVLGQDFYQTSSFMVKQQMYYSKQMRREYKFSSKVKLTRMCIELIHAMMSPNPTERPSSRQILSCNWLETEVKRMANKHLKMQRVNTLLKLQRKVLQQKMNKTKSEIIEKSRVNKTKFEEND